MGSEDLVTLYAGYCALVRLIMRGIITTADPDISNNAEFAWASLGVVYWITYHFICCCIVVDRESRATAFAINYITQLVFYVQGLWAAMGFSVTDADDPTEVQLYDGSIF